ncbi:MAG TPA: transcription elongation factor GreA [Candidatus Eisenbacteria bacterium]|nr:transcription elongation factor GreA [Candidatus Eisenbacteria bacterium]
MDKKIYLTKEGLEDLKKEYEELTKVKRPEMLDRVAQARNQGDLSENAEYTAARDELSFIDGRIEEIEELLKQVTIIEDTTSNGGATAAVALGSKVTVKIGAKEEVFSVVGEWEADPAAKKISHESPLGKALLGKQKGETVEVDAPAGKVLYTVVSVK